MNQFLKDLYKNLSKNILNSGTSLLSSSNTILLSLEDGYIVKVFETDLSNKIFIDLKVSIVKQGFGLIDSDKFSQCGANINIENMADDICMYISYILPE